jgi:hypothetical protein
VALNFSSRRVPLALADDVRGPAVLELSTNPGREHGAVDLTDLVLEPDEGMILRRRTLAERVMSGGVGRRSLGWEDKRDEPIGVNW